MTDNNAISLPQPSALRPQGWEVEVEVISTDLTDEQRALVVQVKQLSAVVHMAGLERAKRLRLLRESFPKVPPGAAESNPDSRPGWEAFLRREFDTNARDVNREIAAIEAGAEKLGDFDGGTSHHRILQEIGSSHLSEIGRGATPAIRRKVWDSLFDGSLNLNARAIRAAVRLLNSDANRVGLKPVAKPLPTPPSSMPKLPIPPKGPAAGFGVFKEISRSKFGDLPERDQEFGFLAGKHAANAKFETDLTALLAKASRSNVGKIMRIKALAAALHREFKGVGDRYQGRWDKDCMYPTYMTLWQHIWAEDDTFHLHDELEAVRKDIAEANRHFGIAVMRLFNDDLEITP